MYRVNLLPDYLQIRRGFHIDFRQLAMLVVFCGLLLTLLLACGIFSYQTLRVQDLLDRDSEELGRLRHRVAEIQKLKAETEFKQDKFEALTFIQNNRLSWHAILQDVPLALPVDTWVNRMEIKKMENRQNRPQNTKPAEKNPTLQSANRVNGQAEPESLPVPNTLYLYGSCWTMGSVGILVDNLNRLPYFDSIKLVEAKHDRLKGVISFQIAAKVKGGEWDAGEIPQPHP